MLVYRNYKVHKHSNFKYEKNNFFNANKNLLTILKTNFWIPDTNLLHIVFSQVFINKSIFIYKWIYLGFHEFIDWFGNELKIFCTIAACLLQLLGLLNFNILDDSKNKQFYLQKHKLKFKKHFIIKKKSKLDILSRFLLSFKTSYLFNIIYKISSLSWGQIIGQKL